MYLSQLWLDHRNRQVLRWLGDCHAMHRAVMSGFPDIASSAARAALGVLYRVEYPADRTTARVLIQSETRPAWVFESGGVTADPPIDLARLEASFAPGKRFRFRILANPTRRVHRRAAEGPDPRELGRNGRWHASGDLGTGERVLQQRRANAELDGAIGKRVELWREEDQLAWLQRKGTEQCGFELVQATVSSGFDGRQRSYVATRADPGQRLFGRQPVQRGQSRDLTFATALFEGELEVSAAAQFAAAFRAGIGPAKAFGCGLLSLAPK